MLLMDKEYKEILTRKDNTPAINMSRDMAWQNIVGRLNEEVLQVYYNCYMCTIFNSVLQKIKEPRVILHFQFLYEILCPNKSTLYHFL